jgi:hypothetical protein
VEIIKKAKAFPQLGVRQNNKFRGDHSFVFNSHRSMSAVGFFIKTAQK